MTKLNLTTWKDKHSCALAWRLALFPLLLLFTLGNQRCEESRAPTIACQAPTIVMEPGTCVPFPNPCDAAGQWGGDYLRPEGFELCPTDEQRALLAASQLSVRTERVGAQTTRSLCVGANSLLFANLPIKFRYGRGRDYGLNEITLTVGRPLTIQVTASPATIALGGSSQLVASVSGGFPPYFYSWIPTGGLNDDDIAAPIARPSVTTTYRVNVTDSSGQSRAGSVTVAVDFGLRVTVNPAVIDAGNNSQLEAIATGGTPPYSYAWTPVIGLNDPTRADPLATPATTTTYNVTVRDATGATRTGSVTLTVNNSSPPPTASFVYNVTCCPTLNVNAGASTGNLVSYTWDLSWTAASPDLVTASPTASFPIIETNRGTITLTVRDTLGRTATTSRNF
jgi:hypothetical protein